MTNYLTHCYKNIPLLFLSIFISCQQTVRKDSNKRIEMTLMHLYSFMNIDEKQLNLEDEGQYYSTSYIEKINEHEYIYKYGVRHDLTYYGYSHIDFSKNKFIEYTSDDTVISYILDNAVFRINYKTKYTVYKTIKMSKDHSAHSLTFYIPEYGSILVRSVGGIGSCIPVSRHVYIFEFVNQNPEVRKNLEHVCNAIFSSGGLYNSFYDLQKNEIDSLEKLVKKERFYHYN